MIIVSRRELPEVDRFRHEDEANRSGYLRVAGIDEAGRGPLAGPVVASAVVIRDRGFVERIDDSKKLAASVREKAYLDIIKRCDVGVGVAGVDEIDAINIFQATLLAMKRAVDDLAESPDYLLVDGTMDVPVSHPRTCIISGESQSMSIACASIIAKVFRDRLMLELDERYPVYGFRRHKGYGTREHFAAIRKIGLSPVHRQSFGPFGRGRAARLPSSHTRLNARIQEKEQWT